MSPVQSSLYIFHEFVVEHLFEVSGILALCLVFSYHLLPHTAYSDAFDDEEDAEEDAEEGLQSRSSRAAARRRDK